MKIAFLVGEFPALSETFILNQVTGLKDLGYKVDIYASQPRNEKKVHPDVKKYDLEECCYYHEVPNNKIKRIFKALILLMLNLHKNPAGLLSVLNFFKYGKTTLSLIPFYAAVSFLNNKSYDIVLCHFGPIGNLGAILKSSGIIKGRLLTVFHGNDISEYIKVSGEDAYQLLFETGDVFLPISEYWKRELVDLGCKEEKIIVHRMGIDTAKFNFSNFENKSNQIKILTTARLVEKKGIEYGIKAVVEVLKSINNVEYIIVGDGPLKKNLKELIDDYQVSKSVKLVGWKEQSELKVLLEEASVILAPSVTSQSGDKEGIPVVLMEALAMGIPVVTTWHSGIPELVKDKECGFLVEERDIHALAKGLKKLILSPELRKTFGENGRRIVENEFNVRSLNIQLVDIFNDILKQNA